MNGSDGFLSITEEQQAELEVMKELHAFCVKHGLRYILAYGTLLGAIRHKGFIPWDNDMDVIMPREDVKKLVEINKKIPSAKMSGSSTIRQMPTTTTPSSVPAIRKPSSSPLI